MNRRILIGVLVVLLLPVVAFAQAAQKMTLEFVDGTDLKVTMADKSVLTFGSGIFEGDPIPVGATVATGPTTFAELKMAPNGSIVKLAKSTSFTIGNLASTPQEKNAFTVLAGKVRTVAAKGAQYQLSSQTAVAGVRGTDFTFNVEEGAKALLMVSKGQVDFAKLDAGGNVLASIPVGAGMAADAFAAAFQTFQFSPEQFAEEFGDLGFKKLVESEVPQAEAAQPPTEPAPAEAPEEKPPVAEESPIMQWLRDNLGFELGSVTINGRGYSKAVIAPDLKFGKVKLGLYLPIIYTEDLFNPNTWYHPAGNDEWSFGMKEFKDGEYLKGTADFMQDLALKIKYFEYGRPLDDPFFIKIGNLEGLTIGHGLVMRNYVNNTEFPSVRRVGFNTGIDGGSVGFEALVNDLADPSIYGARFYLRPVPNFKLALGVSGVVDTNPGADLPAGIDDGDMMFLGTGADLDLPIIPRNPLLGIRAFADVAATVPYIQKDFVAGTKSISKGLAMDLVLPEGGSPKNYGFASGLIGNLLFIDWRLEYRYFTGVFRPSFFDSTYNLKRTDYVLQYIGYLMDPTEISDTPTVMGIYGEGGFNILKDKLVFTLGYMWPWSPDAGTSIAKNLAESSDEFHAKLVVRKGLIPIVDVAGSIVYDRRNLVQTIVDGNFEFIDENTVFGGEIVMPVPKAPNLDLAVVFATVPVRASDGTVQYDGDGNPKMKPSISIETRLHF